MKFFTRAKLLFLNKQKEDFGEITTLFCKIYFANEFTWNLHN